MCILLSLSRAVPVEMYIVMGEILICLPPQWHWKSVALVLAGKHPREPLILLIDDTFETQNEQTLDALSLADIS